MGELITLIYHGIDVFLHLFYHATRTKSMVWSVEERKFVKPDD